VADAAPDDDLSALRRNRQRSPLRAFRPAVGYAARMAADRIQLAQPAPPHCSGCFQAKPTQRHVDFGASYDGPMLPAIDGAAGVIGHSIDELILCEDCINQAAGLLGLVRAEAVVAERDQLEEGNRALRMENAGLRDYTDSLARAVSLKPTAPVKRQAVKR
jgi:hypothetical protein